MFLNIQPIIVPYLSAYDIFQYVDNVGLTISTTGSYYVLQWANDGFNFYPSGFTVNVSGSGSWQGSGFAFSTLDYLYDTLNSYLTGFNTGYFTGGNQVSGYNIFVPVPYSGFMTSNLDYSYENFNSYPTGLFTQTNLFSGNQVSGYFTTFPNFYSGTFNFAPPIKTGTSGGGGNGLPIYTVADTANPNALWSGQILDNNPGGFYLFPYLQNNTQNISVQFYTGPFYGGQAPSLPFPWTGGGPVLVGNSVLNEVYKGGFSFAGSGFVAMSGFGSGVITGDFTLNIIYNWEQNYTPNSYNSWASSPAGSISFTYYTGNNIGINSSHADTGGAYVTLNPMVAVVAGGPPPNSVNYGPNYLPSGQYINPILNATLNQDFTLVDYDMISGFSICLYYSIWSGNTWLMSPNFQNSNPNTVQRNPGLCTYTGMSSGLVVNPYVFFLGNKISGNLAGPNLPLNNLNVTGAIALTGGTFGQFYSPTAFTGAQTGCFGMQVGTIINQPMPQFTGFGFGMAQYLTLTRSGNLVTLYQSGIQFATGFASGAINTKFPLMIGKANRATGVFAASPSGLGLFHFDIWNFCQSQQTIASNLLTYIAPPQTGLILSTNFVLK
jgi:hypothetical protein